MKKLLVLLFLVTISIFVISYFMMLSTLIGNGVGLRLVNEWCRERYINSSLVCLKLINSNFMALEQALSLTLFLLVIVSTAINMEWRIAVAVLAICIAIVMDLVPPRMLIDKATSWDLILFLIGSMTLAGILRSFGVFRYLAIQIVKVGKSNVYLLLMLIAFLSYATSAILGEVASIVYVSMIVVELANILKIDISPLLILAVLATNTGSSALPIGNPIGIYLYYTSKMSISKFIVTSLPLSLINLFILLATIFIISKKYIVYLRNAIEKQLYRIEAFITHYYTQLNGDQNLKRVIFGATILVIFVILVMMSGKIASILTYVAGIEVDEHALLSFIPYICMVLTFPKIYPESIARFLEKSVDWSSIIFFIMLFMLSFTLTYTGAILKIAYILASLGNNIVTLLAIMLISSATLSAFLDNLSVVVALTPIVTLLADVETSNLMFFALLFGGVFGGNYSPIGSTANIVAISIAEKRKIKIGWSKWVKMALMPTTLQILVSILWLYIKMYLNTI